MKRMIVAKTGMDLLNALQNRIEDLGGESDMDVMNSEEIYEEEYDDEYEESF